MNYRIVSVIAASVLTLLSSPNIFGQELSDEGLKIAAIEALITAPAERSLPIVKKVLAGDHSTRVKERALFILSQNDSAEAQATLMTLARNTNSDLQVEAIRMIGIGGDTDSIAQLKDIYSSGSASVRGAVLEALLIAGEPEAVREIAENAEGRDFEEAVEMLGAMGATEHLKGLLGRPGTTQALIHALGIAGDAETLRELALDDSNQLMQIRAIESLGIVGGDSVDETLVQIYQEAKNNSIRDAALHGMMISGHDVGVLQLYRDSESAQEKRRLLEMLVMMGSDDVWDIVDAALEGGI